MLVRVLFAGAAEPVRRKPAESEIPGIEARMLPGEDERRRQPALDERGRDGRQLDRFRPGPNDQPDIGRTQSSP